VKESEQKTLRTQLRKEFKHKRATLSDEHQQACAQNIVEVALAHKLFEHRKRVAIYISQGGELNTHLLIEYLWSQDIEVYLPLLHPFCKGYLVFIRYTRNSVMTENKYGIPEPALDVTALCPLIDLDIIFTPLVAFDSLGNRLGMGGGYYDRTLQHPQSRNNGETAYSSSIQTRIVGLAHDIQKTSALPCEVWDIPLPEVLTPTNFYRFNRS
jgi:5-formyltetrahydrofolate cyclo-ligase